MGERQFFLLLERGYGMIYGTGYWDKYTNWHTDDCFSEELAVWIAQYLKGQEDIPVFDLGCGPGLYLKKLKDHGFNDLTGFEGQPPYNKHFKITRQDITEIFYDEYKSGNVICLEVMEHIPHEYQANVLTNIQHLCNNNLIMSWAVRGQPGHGHINCLDNHEVVAELENLGFKHIEQPSNEARSVISTHANWFKNTILIFKKEMA
jgi:hypothetical protein